MKMGYGAGLSADDLKRRAVDAVIWGMPIVAVDAMRQAFFRDAGAHYGDILHWARSADRKSMASASSTRYIYFNFNLKDGPLVLDVPPAGRADIFGSIVDAWEVPVTDVGLTGQDQGNGGKYVLLPPDFTGTIPEGYLQIRFETFNGYCLLRVMSPARGNGVAEEALEMVRRFRLYPLARSSNPPAQRYIDMAGKRLDGVVQFDESFFERLSRMVNEEPILPRDVLAVGQLRAIGIEKGRAFKADAFTKPILRQAAADALAGFMLGATSGIETGWKRTEVPSRRRLSRTGVPARSSRHRARHNG